MEHLSGPYDLIWSAGAGYFLGVSRALSAWRGALADGGAVAFSHPCLFTDAPSEAAVAFWEAEPGGIATETTSRAEIAAVGWQVHSVRGFIAGTLKKRTDLTVLAERKEGVTRYRVIDKVEAGA